MGTILSKDPNSISGEIRTSRQQINNSSLPKLELHYTEWSSSYTPSDPMHDSYHQAAYILEKIKRSDNAANSMSYWTFTDIFEEAGPRFTPFHGGFGLMNYQDINKPAFFAYKYLNKLGNQELSNTDTSSYSCKDQKGNIQLLLWNFTNTHPGDSVNNQVFYKRNLPAKDNGIVRTVFKNLAIGKYKLQVYKTGYRANDAYTAYFDLGSPNQLTKQQVALLKQKTDDKPIEKIVTIGAAHTFIQENTLRENDVLLLTLNKL